MAAILLQMLEAKRFTLTNGSENVFHFVYITVYVGNEPSHAGFFSVGRSLHVFRLAFRNRLELCFLKHGPIFWNNTSLYFVGQIMFETNNL
jgi:hypothetical protein